MKNIKSKAPRGKKPLTTEEYHRLTGKLSLADARGLLARSKADLETVMDYLEDAFLDGEVESLHAALDPIENADLMLEQLQ